jgi:uncharacterized protein (DUF1015 family)
VTDVAPFRALRYDPDRVDLSRVLVPPYDVVAAHERERFWARDPHNAIRLELTRDARDEAGADYSDVAERLHAWRSEGVLVRDDRPGLYVLRQGFQAPDGATRSRIGFFASVLLEDYERRIVRPHERTMRGPKADRLKLMRASAANLSSIFLLYEDREAELAGALAEALEGADRVDVREESGVEDRLAPLRDSAAVARIRGFLAERPVVIADGHHRYETALAYRDERRRGSAASRSAPWERTLAYLTDAWAPGSLLLPIHRVIRKGPAPTEAAWRERLPGWEGRRIEAPDAATLPGLLERELVPLAPDHAFAADDGSGSLWIFRRAADTELCVRVLHREVLSGVFDLDEEAVREGAVAFPKSASEAARMVREGEGAVALYLNALTPDDVFHVTGAGEVLPQKSTFFAPKLPSGLVFRSLSEDDG